MSAGFTDLMRGFSLPPNDKYGYYLSTDWGSGGTNPDLNFTVTTDTTGGLSDLVLRLSPESSADQMRAENRWWNNRVFSPDMLPETMPAAKKVSVPATVDRDVIVADPSRQFSFEN